MQSLSWFRALVSSQRALDLLQSMSLLRQEETQSGKAAQGPPAP